MPSEEHLKRHHLNWLVSTNKEQGFCQQTGGTFKSNSPSRYVRETLEVPAFHREQRQRRVGVLHIPPLWLIHRSKIHLLFKVACWLPRNVKRIKPTWKEGQIVCFRPEIFKATWKPLSALLSMLLTALAARWRSKTTAAMVDKVFSMMTNASLQQLVSLQQPAVFCHPTNLLFHCEPEQRVHTSLRWVVLARTFCNILQQRKALKYFNLTAVLFSLCGRVVHQCFDFSLKLWLSVICKIQTCHKLNVLKWECRHCGQAYCWISPPSSGYSRYYNRLSMPVYYHFICYFNVKSCYNCDVAS